VRSGRTNVERDSRSVGVLEVVLPAVRNRELRIGKVVQLEDYTEGAGFSDLLRQRRDPCGRAPNCGRLGVRSLDEEQVRDPLILSREGFESHRLT